VLMLDEPTNHLDLDAVLWLEAWLQRFAGTLLLVSHDREFLDAITKVTLHLDEGKLIRYGGNYTSFETQRAERMVLQQAAFAKQQDRVAHLQKFIDRFKAKASKAKQAQSRVKALERMEKVDTLVVDKTGTLTEGKPKVVAIVAAAGFSESDLLQLAASVECASEHPLADAIVRAAKDRNLALKPVGAFDSPTGKGATGKVDGKSIVLGNAFYLNSLDIATTSLEAEAERLRQDGATVINMAIDSSLAGLLAIADPIKPSTSEALRALKADGIKVIMLTGDNRTTAKAVAGKLGLNEVEAEVLPDQKSAVVTKLRHAGWVVAMAGDGVNDAPALAAAEVGIAMGTGTDVAMESAGVTLLKGDLTGIVRARKLSQATMRNIRQNLFFAFIYNAAGIPIAAGVLYPTFGILLSPIIAAAAMALSSVSVVGNALRLRATRL